MIIQPNPSQPNNPMRSLNSHVPGSGQPQDQVTPRPCDAGMAQIELLRDYARQPQESPALPPQITWTSPQEIATLLQQASTNVPERQRSGAGARAADAYLRRALERGSQEGGSRPVQVHGGPAQVHWNPHLSSMLQLFDQPASPATVRISQVVPQADPEGKSLCGFALEFDQQDKSTALRFSGGRPENLQHLTAWSRAPFAVQGKNGQEYLVKLQLRPALPSQDADPSELSPGEARWNLNFQFLQPGDKPEDLGQAWSGPWVKAAEIVLPSVNDEARPQASSPMDSRKAPAAILRPWGEANRARQTWLQLQ